MYSSNQMVWPNWKKTQTNQDFYRKKKKVCTWIQYLATMWNLLLNWDPPLMSQPKNEHLFGQQK